MDGDVGTDKPVDEVLAASKPAVEEPKTDRSKPAQKARSSKKRVTKKPARATQTQPPKSGKFAKRPFPGVTLEEALKIPQAIRQKNNGHPWDTNLVATACGVARTSTSFFYLAAAARDYSLTVGSRDTAQISLAELGKALLYAPSADIEREKKIEAFLSVEKFKQVYDYYEGSNLPEKQYLANTLENRFQLDPDDHEQFTNLFTANCEYLGIGNGMAGVKKGLNGTADTKGIDTRSLGKPKGDFDRTAFVIMPFSEKGKQERAKGFFDEVLKSVITPAGNSAGFAIETARREDSDIIHHTIINELLHADLVIADLTDHNPNVLLELGIRLAKEKPIVLIKSADTGPIFDVDNLLRVFTYNQNLWSTTVQADAKALAERIGGTWDNRESAVGYMQILTAGPQPAR